MYEKDKLQQLIERPSESLDVELKRWLDLSAKESIAKLAKGCMALYNNNGGYFVIGFNDDATPDSQNIPSEIRCTYHVDLIQGIVGKYAHRPFPIDVEILESNGQQYPIVIVPDGVRIPVVCKADLREGDNHLLKDNAVYVRSISANNRVSSTEARRGDWERLVSHCFDNREADVGQFVRRHLAGLLEPTVFASLFRSREAVALLKSATDRAKELLNDGYQRYTKRCNERKLDIPKFGYREFAVELDGEIAQGEPTRSLLQRLEVTMPKHSGWPPWVILAGSADTSLQPFVDEGVWECLLPMLTDGFFGASIDYWRLDPVGELYHLRTLEDDAVAYQNSGRGPSPGTSLDFAMQIGRLAEAVSVALAIARELACDVTSTSLVFAARWQGLKDRQLTAWAGPPRLFRPSAPSVQNDVTTEFIVPLETPPAGILPHVESAIRKLFTVFGGHEISSSVIEEIVNQTLKR